MPVIVPSRDYARWLDCSNVDAADLLVAWQGELHVHPVSARVNAVANDDASLCEAVAADESPDEAHAPEQLPLL